MNNRTINVMLCITSLMIFYLVCTIISMIYQNSQPIFVGYWDGEKHDVNKQYSLKALDAITDLIKNNPNNQSIAYRDGNIASRLWIGAKIDSNSFIEAGMGILKTEISKHGIPANLYMEHVAGDPDMSFGMTIDTEGDKNVDKLANAVKLWSRGQPFNTSQGGKFCRGQIKKLEYQRRKTFNNDVSVGSCLYEAWGRRSTPEGVCQLPFNNVYYDYNDNLDFQSIPLFYPVCCSIGSRPDLRPKQNPDGTCHIYSIEPGDGSCIEMAAKFYPLKGGEINEYNKDNPNYYGCGVILYGSKICVSPGRLPDELLDRK